MSLVLSPPPTTPVEPVTEVLHGVPITDPYRWLEDQNSPRTRKWLEEQTTYARAYLGAIPGRERIRNRVKELIEVESVTDPWKAANRYFFLKRAAHQEQPAIVMRDGDSGADVVLVDPTERDAAGKVSVNIVNISIDGQFLAYSVRFSGEDSCTIEFLNVDQRVTLQDQLPRGLPRGLVFAPEGGGFYYIHGLPGARRPNLRAVYWHRFGTQFDTDTEIFSIDHDPKRHLYMCASLDGLCLCYMVASFQDPRTADFYIHDLASGNAAQRIVEGIEAVLLPQFAHKKLIIAAQPKSNVDRIVLIDPANPQREAWREIVPATKGCIRNFAVVDSWVLVELIENAFARIDLFDLSGEFLDTLIFPSNGTPRILGARPGSESVFCSFTSFSQPSTIFRWRTHTRKQEVWTANHVPFDSESLEVERIEYDSKDGTRVPLFLVAQKGRRHSEPLPTFLTGYGGFGTSVTPQFTAYAALLIEHGFLFAVANLRGGSEFGKEWHLAGAGHNRQNVIDDFIAGAEWLVTRRLADPSRIAIGGGSNAGLLVGAALTQRPDLFRVVVCLGPLLDMLRYHHFDLAGLYAAEFGCADEEADFHVLRTYSPYHQVKDGVAYPSVMMISGDADTRCNPMHARKMTARLRAATSSDNPILLDYKSTWGHMPVQPLGTRIEALTDKLAFICHELGVNA